MKARGILAFRRQLVEARIIVTPGLLAYSLFLRPSTYATQAQIVSVPFMLMLGSSMLEADRVDVEELQSTVVQAKRWHIHQT